MKTPSAQPPPCSAAAANRGAARRRRPPLKARIADFAWREAKRLAMAYLKWKEGR